MGDRRGAYRVLVGRSEGRRPLGKPRHKWNNNIKMDFLEVGWGTDWLDLVQDKGPVESCFKCGNEPSDSIKCGTFLD